ncbi:hypothetical protein HDU96_004816 [Phlyctochytrium bullatum]|nr:hypothetical protein HDU96_004816 [Phlyctochytrium bullatum]
MPFSPFRYIEKSRSLHLHVLLKPNAKRSAVVGIIDEALHLQIAAPPRDGEANKEVVQFVSKLLGLPKSCVSIVAGHKAREKVVALEVPGLKHPEDTQEYLRVVRAICE